MLCATGNHNRTTAYPYATNVLGASPPPDAPPSEGFVVSRNVDYPTFLKAVQTARVANDPKVVAIRVKRPGRAPEFGADANGSRNRRTMPLRGVMKSH